MLWKEKGVEKDSYMSFFNPDAHFKNYYYYMFSCGYFHTNSDYLYESEGNRPPLFFFIVSGSLHIEYNNKKYIANKNDIVLINCYNYNKYYCKDNCEFLFFHFDGKEAVSLTNNLIESNKSPVFHLKKAQSIYNLLNNPIMALCRSEERRVGKECASTLWDAWWVDRW